MWKIFRSVSSDESIPQLIKVNVIGNIDAALIFKAGSGADQEALLMQMI